jgi:SAM-dependent methyltransferase
MSETQTTADLHELQAKINAFWTWRGDTIASGALAIRDEAELTTWMELLRDWLPPAPADVVDLGTDQGFVALVMAALGQRVRGYDLAEGQLMRAREYASASGNPPQFVVGDAAAPPLEPASVDVIANRDVLRTLLNPARAFANWWTALRPGGRLLVFHGVTLSATTQPQTQSRGDALYSGAVAEQLLPLRHQPTLDPALPVAIAAGFADARVTRLEPIEQFVKQLEDKNMVWLVLTATRSAS